MLGKGLESLIPKKEDNNPEHPVGDVNLVPETNNFPVPAPIPSPMPESNIVPEGLRPAPIPEVINNQPIEPVQPTQREAVESVKPKLPTEYVFQIEVEKIRPNPHQPRRYFDEAALKELALSIQEFGILQPLVVSKIEKESETGTTVEYELIAGERRLMASKLAGLRTVPAIIRKAGPDREKLELAVIENLQRTDLNPIEMARAFARLQDEFRLTQREIGARLGKSREVIANSVRLLNLPSEIQEAVSDGRVGESQARLLLAVDDIMSQRKLFEEILRSNLSVRDIKSRVRNIKSPEAVSGVPSTTVLIDPEVEMLKEQLQDFLGTKVDVNKSGDGGKLTINFYSAEELKSIAGKLLKNPFQQ